jgi:LysM repeat protein
MEDSRRIYCALAIAILFLSGCATTEPAKEPEPEAKAVEDVKPPEPQRVEPPPAPPTETYSVVRGDHLWGISAKPVIYGNPYQWPLIYKANRDKIRDADLIHPGQVLTIGKNPSAGDADAAVQHARTRGAWKLGVVEESDRSYLARYQ